VVTLGNHDFDNGVEALAAAMKFAKFDFVSTNYDVRGTILESRVKPYAVRTFGDVRVGLFGMGVSPDNLITPDNGEKFLVELENATLTNIKGFLVRNPDLTLTINRSDLEQTMMGAKTLEAQIADGTAKVEGNAVILKQLASTMVDFDPRFEIMPGTKARGPEVAHADPYEVVPRQTIAE